MKHCSPCVPVLVMLFAAVARADVVADNFGALADGTPVQRWTISNKQGASAAVMSYGATLLSLKMPDRGEKVDDIVLGYDDFKGYQRNFPFFGVVVGRYGNRIGGARFMLNGTQYTLDANDRGNTLHGGRRGFDKVLWTGAKIDDHTVELTYLSKDGEQGFPGNLTTRVRYSLDDANTLKIEYFATTDKDTVINLTNHSYFNLAGGAVPGNGDVLKQELMIDADQFTPCDAKLIPTGALAPVEDTPFDFRQAHAIGERIATDTDQIRFAHGYDMNFVLTKRNGLRHAATAYDPASGRLMEVWTTQPGVQFYTGNGLNGNIVGKEGKAYLRYGAFCLETQHFPDSPNEPTFPSTTLKPGKTYHEVTEYRFSAKDAATQPVASAATDLSTGWTLIKEGEAEGTIEQDAHHPTNANAHLLRIAVTKTAELGMGRVGATSAVPVVVRDGEWFDVRFTAATERGSVGLVFSLETADGKVLARTTLPEIGQGRGRRPTTAPVAWQKYLVALHARGSDLAAHMVITPIEPTNIWLDQLTMTPR